MDKISIKGVAIRHGISRNGIKYPMEEINNFAQTLSGRPFLKDHKAETDNTIGVVERGFSDGDGVAYYEGWIKEDGSGIIEKIMDGRVKEVSIGAYVGKIVEEENDDGEITLVATEMEGLELSTTPTPGIRGTSLQQAMEKIKEGNKNIPAITETLNVSNISEKIKRDEVSKLEETKIDVDVLKEEVKKELLAEQERKVQEQKEIEAKETSLIEKIEAMMDKKLESFVKEAEEPEAEATAEPEAEATAEPEATANPEDKTEGEVGEDKVEKEEQTEESYVVEKSDIGEGFSLSKKTKSDGSYI